MSSSPDTSSFVPDDVKFDEEPKDAATDVNLSAYTPKLFTSSATATSKVSASPTLAIRGDRKSVGRLYRCDDVSRVHLCE